MKRIVMMMFAIMLTLGALTVGLCGVATAEDAPKKGKGKGDHFAKLDTNSDGKVSLDEFTAGKTDKALEKAKKVFAKMDADSDGNVTKEEMKAAAEAHGKKDGGGKKNGGGKKKDNA